MSPILPITQKYQNITSCKTSPEPGDKLQTGLRALCGQISKYVSRSRVDVLASILFEAYTGSKKGVLVGAKIVFVLSVCSWERGCHSSTGGGGGSIAADIFSSPFFTGSIQHTSPIGYLSKYILTKYF